MYVRVKKHDNHFVGSLVVGYDIFIGYDDSHPLVDFLLLAKEVEPVDGPADDGG